MGFHAQRTLADAAAGVGAVEDRQMLFLQIGRAFQGHGAADMGVGGIDIGLGEAQRLEHVEVGRIHRGGVQLQHLAAEIRAKRVFVEDKADVEGGFQRRFDGADLLLAEALAAQGVIVHPALIVLQRAVTHGIGDDGVDFLLAIAQVCQGFRHAAIDDLEIAAARQGLELDQGEVGLHASCVAIHHQADGAGWRDHGGLGVAEAMLLAQLQGFVPGALGGIGQGMVFHRLEVQRHGRHGQFLIARVFAMGGAAMVADHPQHRFLVGGIFREGSQLARHLGAGGIGDAGHQCGYGARHGAAFAGIV